MPFFRILPRIITMNHGTRSTVKSLELAGNEKSRLDWVPILFYASSIPPLATSATANPFLSRCPSSSLPLLLRNSSGKSEPQSGASSWLERRIFHRRKSALSPFALRLSSHRSFIPSGSGLENQRTKRQGWGDQLEKLNYLAK